MDLFFGDYQCVSNENIAKAAKPTQCPVKSSNATFSTAQVDGEKSMANKNNDQPVKDLKRPETGITTS